VVVNQKGREATIRLFFHEILPQLTTHSHTPRPSTRRQLETPVVSDTLMVAPACPSDEVGNMKTCAQATSDKTGDACGLNSVAILDAFDSRHRLDIWQHPGCGL
jgi:hypothetical protein